MFKETRIKQRLSCVIIFRMISIKINLLLLEFNHYRQQYNNGSTCNFVYMFKHNKYFFSFIQRTFQFTNKLQCSLRVFNH